MKINANINTDMKQPGSGADPPRSGAPVKAKLFRHQSEALKFVLKVFGMNENGEVIK